MWCVLHTNRSGLDHTVRGLLDRKRSKEHLQSSNESMNPKTKQKRQNKGTIKHMPVKERRRALDKDNLVNRQPRAMRYPPRSQLSRICTQRHSIYNIRGVPSVGFPTGVMGSLPGVGRVLNGRGGAMLGVDLC